MVLSYKRNIRRLIYTTSLRGSFSFDFPSRTLKDSLKRFGEGARNLAFACVTLVDNSIVIESSSWWNSFNIIHSAFGSYPKYD